MPTPLSFRPLRAIRERARAYVGTLGRNMAPAKRNGPRHWVAADVSQDKRLDYFATALSEAIVPFSIDHVDPRTFYADISRTQVGVIPICKLNGEPHRSIRGARELARTDQHGFNLILPLHSGWMADHRGSQQVSVGDVFIHDSRYPLMIDARNPFVSMNVGLPEAWLRHWVPDPHVLSGRHISGDSPWGRALFAFLCQLSPELMATPVLPESVLEDQIGSLLALSVQDVLGHVSSAYTSAARSLRQRILECIEQRCSEPALTAADVAASLNVSLRTLHRTLAAAQETFGVRLIDARVRVARRMLESALFNRVTTAEIGRRAGFANPSHFARVLRKRTGLTPLKLRNGDLRSVVPLETTHEPADVSRTGAPAVAPSGD